MITSIEYRKKEMQAPIAVSYHGWQRVLLLWILGYEAAGCLVGGILLIAKPDGSLMDMPVDIMDGAFSTFLIPGMLLFALGILNARAFFSLLKRKTSGWLMTALALGGLAIWFVVEIIILKGVHWLHIMWGFPVFLGLVMYTPVFLERRPSTQTAKALLWCGILSSLWYVAINIFIPFMYNGYNAVSQTVSELSAIGAPTRVLWVLMCMLYLLLFAAFGWGVVQIAGTSRRLAMAGALIIIYSILNFFWPPMHQRIVLAAGGGTLTDTLHIAWAMATLLFMMLIMGYGAAASGKRFRLYTLATWIVFLVFGALTGIAAPGINANLPTPLIGVWERINIGAFMLWVIVFALSLQRKVQAQEKLAERY